MRELVGGEAYGVEDDGQPGGMLVTAVLFSGLVGALAI